MTDSNFIRQAQGGCINNWSTLTTVRTTGRRTNLLSELIILAQDQERVKKKKTLCAATKK